MSTLSRRVRGGAPRQGAATCTFYPTWGASVAVATNAPATFMEDTDRDPVVGSDWVIGTDPTELVCQVDGLYTLSAWAGYLWGTPNASDYGKQVLTILYVEDGKNIGPVYNEVGSQRLTIPSAAPTYGTWTNRSEVSINFTAQFFAGDTIELQTSWRPDRALVQSNPAVQNGYIGLAKVGW